MTKVGDVVKSKVTQITKFGAMVTLENGEAGFIHISKIANQYVKNVEDFLKQGQEITARIIGKTKDGKWELSLKEQKGSEKGSEEQKGTSKAEFEKKLARFMKESERKMAEYRKRVEKKGGRF